MRSIVCEPTPKEAEDMPETVRIREDQGIIEVRSYGRVVLEDMLRSRKTIDRIYQERGYTKTLIDAREGVQLPSTVDLFMFGIGLGETFVANVGKFAIVVSEKTRSSLEFIASTARKRGIQMMTFASVKEATAWLQAKSQLGRFVEWNPSSSDESANVRLSPN
jgi:hypothetical protein